MCKSFRVSVVFPGLVAVVLVMSQVAFAGVDDTLNLSGYATPSSIDLNPGAFSSACGSETFLTLEQINANNAAAGLARSTVRR